VNVLPKCTIPSSPDNNTCRSVMRLTERCLAIGWRCSIRSPPTESNTPICSVRKCMARLGLPPVRSKASNKCGGKQA
jgi:hypothetical protein